MLPRLPAGEVQRITLVSVVMFGLIVAARQLTADSESVAVFTEVTTLRSLGLFFGALVCTTMLSLIHITRAVRDLRHAALLGAMLAVLGVPGSLAASGSMSPVAIVRATVLFASVVISSALLFALRRGSEMPQASRA